MRTSTALTSSNFSFTLDNLDPPGTESFRAGLQNAAMIAFMEGMEFDEIYNKFCSIIPGGTMTKREIMTLIDPAIALFPGSQSNLEIEAPEASVPESGKADNSNVDDDNNYEVRLAALSARLDLKIGDDEIKELLREIREIKLLQNLKNVSLLLLETPAPPDQILADIFDTQDKFVIIGSAKMKKSFFAMMLLMSLAAGKDFFTFRIPKPRRVVLVQLEIQETHFHRRVIGIAKALGITPEDLDNRFHVINCRGLGVEGHEGVELIGRVVESLRPEVILFDPLYKISSGSENAAEDAKLVLSDFDALIERTDAAVGYVHHDAKGASGDRNIRDRGAGSNVINRDYDACFTLTPHATNAEAVVIESLLRNYKDPKPFTVLWEADESTGGYCFAEHSDIVPEKKTSKTRTQPPDLKTYLPVAAAILADNEMEIAKFKEVFKGKSGLSDNRIKNFLAWAVAGGNPYLDTREDRGRGKNKKWIKVARGLNDV